MCQRPARGRNKCFERVPALTPAGSKICLRLNIRRVSQRGPRVIPTGEPPSAQMKQNILEPLKIITCFLSPSQRKPAACAYPMAGRSLEAVRSEKLRPAIVLADARRGDWVLCQITSQPYGDPDAILGNRRFRARHSAAHQLRSSGHAFHCPHYLDRRSGGRPPPHKIHRRA